MIYAALAGGAWAFDAKWKIFWLVLFCLQLLPAVLKIVKMMINQKIQKTIGELESETFESDEDDIIYYEKLVRRFRPVGIIISLAMIPFWIWIWWEVLSF